MNQSLWHCFSQTLRACVTNMACAPFFMLAALFYAFYYCWPYMSQLPLHIDTVIVDEDHSPVSRALSQALKSEPNYNIVAVCANRPSAVRLMQMGEISAIIGIPQNFERNLLSGIPTALTLVANGAFIVEAHTALTGGAGPLKQIAQQAIMAELAKAGIPAARLLSGQNSSPALLEVAMYNTISGYLSFAVSIVFIIIFQTLMMCGMCMLLNDWFAKPKLPEPMLMALQKPSFLLCLELPVICICVFWCLFVEGWIFYFQGINSFQNVVGTILASLFFAWAVCNLGLLLALLFRNSHFAIPVLVLSSLPCVFISGNLFPWQNIPAYMRAFAWLIPSTPGVDAMLRASQSGASPLEIFPYLMHMLFLGCLYFCAAMFYRRKIHFSPGNDTRE